MGRTDPSFILNLQHKNLKVFSKCRVIPQLKLHQYHSLSRSSRADKVRDCHFLYLTLSFGTTTHRELNNHQCLKLIIMDLRSIKS